MSRSTINLATTNSRKGSLAACFCTLTARAGRCRILQAIKKSSIYPAPKSQSKKTGRGVYEITDFGKQILKSKDAQAKFEAWYDEIYKNKSAPSAEISQTVTQEKTPIDVIAETASELAQNLKSQILDEISQKKAELF